MLVRSRTIVLIDAIQFAYRIHLRKLKTMTLLKNHKKSPPIRDYIALFLSAKLTASEFESLESTSWLTGYK